ncbi:polysaccharide deacetylase family protein [Meiothermus rufus]|uniref:polysaccharide deacetylase family protein n=1 Tax=Meiothermus rufus TaxID=604332 RepID=UPI0003FB32A5|nr:polysaccharide deacetylase family protein [Meiothermus rufus]
MNPYSLPLRALRQALVKGYQLGRAVRSPQRRTLVLNYHSVRPAQLFFNSTPTQVFEQHLEWLAAHCEVVDFAEVCGPASHKPRVAITFDDGFRDNLEFAVPLLQKYGLKATFFISTGFLERDPVILDIFARTFQTTANDFMDAEALRELFAAGMRVGAHTHSHRNLLSLSAREQEEELGRSKTILEDLLGQPIQSVAYPFGVPGKAFDLTTTQIAEALGYSRGAMVCWRGVRAQEPVFRIPRFIMVRESLAELEAIVGGAWDPIGWYQDWRFSLRASRQANKPYPLAVALLEQQAWMELVHCRILGLL